MTKVVEFNFVLLHFLLVFLCCWRKNVWPSLFILLLKSTFNASLKLGNYEFNYFNTTTKKNNNFCLLLHWIRLTKYLHAAPTTEFSTLLERLGIYCSVPFFRSRIIWNDTETWKMMPLALRWLHFFHSFSRVACPLESEAQST